MRVALVLFFVSACAACKAPDAPTVSAPVASTATVPIVAPAPSAAPPVPIVPSAKPVASSSVCAAGEVLVLGRYEPLCATACASDPDCKTTGPCDDATDIDGHPVKVCAATGEPPKKKP